MKNNINKWPLDVEQYIFFVLSELLSIRSVFLLLDFEEIQVWEWWEAQIEYRAHQRKCKPRKQKLIEKRYSSQCRVTYKLRVVSKVLSRKFHSMIHCSKIINNIIEAFYSNKWISIDHYLNINFVENGLISISNIKDWSAQT